MRSVADGCEGNGAKGVEERTIKLMEVCRLRTTPILTFVNKFHQFWYFHITIGS